VKLMDGLMIFLCPSVLIARDSVSTSRFLANKFQAMLDFICSKNRLIGEVYITSGGENVKVDVYNIFIYYFGLKMR